MSKTHIAFVLDMSGSMSATEDDTRGGVATYINKTKEELPEARFNLTIFDTVFETWVDDVPLRALDGKKVISEYKPRGMTALYDAIGLTLKKLKKVVEPEDKAIVVVMTDGHENSSRKESKQSIGQKIAKLQKKGNWTFVYLGANVDVWAEGGGIGIIRTNTVPYTYGKGQFRALDNLSYATVALAASPDMSSPDLYGDAGIDPDFVDDEVESGTS